MKKNEMPEREISVFKEKLAYLRAIEYLYNECREKVSYLTIRQEIDGKEEEQATKWDGTLIWEDEDKTIPHYRNKYKAVPIPLNSLDDDEYASYIAYMKIMKSFEDILSKI